MIVGDCLNDFAAFIIRECMCECVSVRERERERERERARVSE